MRRRLRSQHGFSLIEAIVAALVLTVGATALATVLISGQAQASSDVQESQLINTADAKIEAIRSQIQAGGFFSLALATAPTPAGSAPGTVQSTWADPNSFVQTSAGCGLNNVYFEIESAYDSGTSANPPAGFMQWAGCGTDGEPVQVLSGGSIISGSGVACGDTYLTNCTVSIGSQTVTVDTFVTDTYVPCNTTSNGAAINNFCPSLNTANTQITGCPGLTGFPTSVSASSSCADARRVTVAVIPPATRATGSRQSQRTTPVYLSTVFTNPAPDGGTSTATGITLGTSL